MPGNRKVTVRLKIWQIMGCLKFSREETSLRVRMTWNSRSPFPTGRAASKFKTLMLETKYRPAAAIGVHIAPDTLLAADALARIDRVNARLRARVGALDRRAITRCQD